VHHRRKASIGDKISGAMLKLKGSLTHRPGVKVRLTHTYLPGSLILIIHRLLEQDVCTELMDEEVIVCIRVHDNGKIIRLYDMICDTRTTHD
jgi:hypothetical protein